MIRLRLYSEAAEGLQSGIQRNGIHRWREKYLGMQPIQRLHRAQGLSEHGAWQSFVGILQPIGRTAFHNHKKSNIEWHKLFVGWISNFFECCKKLSHILITHSSQYSLSEHSLKAICNLQWSPPCCVHKRLPGYLRQCWFHYRGEKLVLQYTYSLFTITYYFPKHLNAFLVKSE